MVFASFSHDDINTFMYRKEEDHLIAEKYEQINELFGKQHLKQFGSWLGSKFGSTRATQSLINIKQANKLVNQMKRDSVDDGVDFDLLDPDWVYGWSKERLGFDPSEYDVKYFTGGNQSKFIQDALAARSKFLRTQRVKTSTPTPSTPSAPKPTVDPKDKIANIAKRWPSLSKTERSDIFESLSEEEARELHSLLPVEKKKKKVVNVLDDLELPPTEEELND